jgi:hypothetical protein
MNLVDILDAIYQADTEAWTDWAALPEDVRNHPWIAKPEKPQIRIPQQQHWTMRGVVTGSRRKWKRGRK